MSFIPTMEYKLITPDYYDAVISHLKDSFFSDEPLNKSVGLCKQGVGNAELEHHSYETLQDNLSLMAITSDKKIAGVILNGVLQPGHVEQSQISLESCDDENFKKIFRLLYGHNLSVNLYERFNVEKIFDVRIMSVDANFRGQGIAKELVRHTDIIAKKYHFKVMKADATGIFSQKILKSNGFSVISEIYYDKYLDEFGKPVLPVEPPHIKLELLYKILN